LPVRVRALPPILSFVLAIGLLGVATPDRSAASTQRVAILVGPTEITDSHYLTWAREVEQTAAEAGAIVDFRYCPTPAEAKQAVNGANIIVYLGHGNGFPNPYSSTKNPASVNGWGLRDPAKADWDGTSCRDNVLRYYGEDYLTGKLNGNGWTGGAITPAPNFVMVYSNACYAPGAGEQRPAPTESVAVARVANYANPILELGGTYFATDLGSRQLVDLILRNPATAFAEIFQSAPGFSAAALRTHPHPEREGKKVWVQKTNSQWLGEDYWFAFSGEPWVAPNGTSVLYRGAFTDIWESPFRDNIVWLAGSGITAGCTMGKYCPRETVTREQMASFLVRALKLPHTSTDFFTDDNGSPHQGDINRLAASGITGGCAPGRFCPRDTVTREQMASFLVRGLKLPWTGTDYFTDDNGSPHEGDINRLAASGITGGCAPGRFCPGSVITREQMAAFLHRAFDR
jgi:hypothetical protein